MKLLQILLALSLLFPLATTANSPEPYKIISADRHDKSLPLRNFTRSRVQPLEVGYPKEIPRRTVPPPVAKFGRPETAVLDSGLQSPSFVPRVAEPLQSFDGISNQDNADVIGFPVVPADPNIDVGPDHIVQMVNITFAVWDKQGNLLLGPLPNNSVWDGFGGPCERDNSGDPIVLYDHLADRWLISQFAINTGAHECVAISETGDPTGAYYRYQFSIGGFPDYPKIGVWPEAYYVTFRQFDSGPFNMLAGAFEREKMLVGQDAKMVIFSITDELANAIDGVLPADLDGPPPPAGTPGIFLGHQDAQTTGADVDRLVRFELEVNWDNPDDSVFNGPYFLPTLPFDSDLCGFSRDCIPQPETSQRLDAIPEFLMHRLAFRYFGSYMAMVANHTVDVGDVFDHAGIRWYELRNNAGDWEVYQQGTYAPDAEHRWMGSIAMDAAGNIGLSYSVSGDTVYPSIRYTGRFRDDPAGAMTVAEETLQEGMGAQTGANRWGDYTTVTVDPADGSTFWITNIYYPESSARMWHTRIGSFRFEVDEIPPAPITDLDAIDAGSNFVVLQWTAVGDDDVTGIATAYDVRYSPLGEINEADFDAAVPAENPPLPKPSGEIETFILKGLDFSANYWFVIKVSDNLGNMSAISNAATAMTLEAPTISVLPDLLDPQELFTGERAIQEFTVTNSGNGTLDVEVVVIDFDPGALNRPIAPSAVSKDLDANHHDRRASVDSGLEWLTVSLMTGTVPMRSGESVRFAVAFDAFRLPGGSYDAEIHILSNDPMNPDIILPARLDVTDAPDIEPSASALDFGSVFVGGSATLTVSISNFGTDVLTVAGITHETDAFSVASQGFVVSPGESHEIEVVFAPPADGEIDDALIIASNDPDEPEVTIDLAGIGILPPEIAVDRQELQEHLVTGARSTQTLMITNAGVSDLEFVISIEDSRIAAALSRFAEIFPLGTEKTFSNRRRRWSASPAPLDRPYNRYTDVVGTDISDAIPVPPDIFSAFPEGILFNVDALNSSVDELNPMTGEIVRSIALPEAAAAGPDGLAFDGTYLYFINGFGTNTIYQLDTDTGDIVDTATIPGLEPIDALGHSGDLVYALGYGGDTVYAIDFQSATVVSQFRFSFIGGGMSFGGSRGTLFVSDFATAIYEFEPESGDLINIIDTPNMGTILGLGYSEALGILFASNVDDGMLYGLDPDDGTALFSYPVALGSGIASDESAGVFWLGAIPVAGTIPGDSAAGIEVTFDAAGLPGADYHAEIIITSNDPAAPEVIVPVHLQVTDAPDIEIPDEALDFGAIFVDESNSRSFRVTNVGTELLAVTDIAIDDDAFAVDITEFELNPGESKELPVTFSPRIEGEFAGVLTIASNDPDEPVVTMVVRGVALLPPEIAVDPVSLQTGLVTGASLTQRLTVFNHGASDLEFTLAIATPPPPARPSGVAASPTENPQLIIEAFIAEKDLNAGFSASTTARASLQTPRQNTIPTGVRRSGPMPGGHKSDPKSPLPIVIEDPEGDGRVVDVTFVRGARIAGEVLFEIEFSTVIDPFDFGGYLSLDIDQNPGTGLPPSFGAPEQDIGVEYELSFFAIFSGILSLTNVITGDFVAEYPIDIDSRHLSFSVPLEDLENDDGLIDVTGVLGDAFGPTDWFPNSGHGTIGVGSPSWLTVDSFAGTIAPGSSMDIDVRFDAAGLAGGDYEADIIVNSNDPNAPEIIVAVDMHVTSAPDIEVADERLDFGFVFVTGNKAGIVTIANAGVELLTINDITTDHSDFAVDNAGFDLHPGEIRDVGLVFAPSAEGEISADLTIESNDPDEPVVTVALQGFALVPPDIVLDPDELQQQLHTGASATQLLRLANEGVTELEFAIRVESLSGLGPREDAAGHTVVNTVSTLPIDFISVDPDAGTVSPGADVEIAIRFNAFRLPGADYFAELIVTSNDPDESTLTVPVSLHVIDAPDIGISDNEFNFGTVFVGVIESRTLIIVNNGTEVLSVANIVSDHTDFAPDIPQLDLLPNESADIKINFQPTTDGDITATLVIESNDPDSPLEEVHLQGVGRLPPQIDIAPTTLAENLITGQILTPILTIANVGFSDLQFAISVHNSESTPIAGLPVWPDKERSRRPRTRASKNGAVSGSLYASTARADDLIIIDPADGHGTLVGSTAGFGPVTEIEFSDDGILFGATGAGNSNLITIDVATGIPTLVASDFFGTLNGLEFDANGALYGTFAPIGEQGSVLVTIDYLTGELNFIGATGFGKIGGLAFAADGTLYGVTSGFPEAGELIIIDPMTGAGEVVGKTGFNDVAALEYSRDAQILYGGIGGNDVAAGSLITIDPATGMGALIGATGFPVVSGLSFAPGGFALPAEFLSVAPAAGTVVPDSLSEITVRIDASGVAGGDYFADLLITSNDPLQPEVIVPVQLHVTAAPDIELSDTVLDFGPVFIGDSDNRKLTVSNNGIELLTITAISADVGDFVPDLSEFDLNPGDSREIEVTFAPSEAGAVGGSLSISSNDPDEPRVEVNLTGDGRVPPDITVDPSELQEDLFTGQVSTQVLTIANDGVSDLEFEIILDAKTGASPRTWSAIVSTGNHTTTVGANESPRLEFRGANGFSYADFYESQRRPANATGRFLHASVDGSPNGSGHHRRLLSALQDGTLIFSDDMESGVNGWSHYPVKGNVDLWRQTGSRTSSGFTSWNVAQHAFEGGDALQSPRIDLTGFQNAVLTFRHWYNFDDCSGDPTFEPDGGIVEISTDQGLTWQQIVPVDGYPFTLDNICDNPLAFRDAYSHDGGDDMFLAAVFDLSPYSGTPVFVRFYAGWDCGNCDLNEGWYIDDVDVFAENLVSWLFVDPNSGTVVKETALEVEVTFDSFGLPGGDYHADIIINSNDPDEREVLIPVNLHVTGAPDIRVQEEDLDFGTVFVGGVEVRSLHIFNDGAEPLTVTAISSDTTEFSAAISTFNLDPGAGYELEVVFAPGSEAVFAGILTIESNDPDESIIEVELNGVGAPPPDIAVAPVEFQEELFTGQVSTQILTISNEGAHNLEFAIQIKNQATISTATLITGNGGDARFIRDRPALEESGQRVLYAATGSASSLITIAAASGRGTLIGPITGFGAITEIEFRDDGTLFGATGGEFGNLITIDPATGVPTLVHAHLPRSLTGLDFDRHGTLFGTHISFSGGPSQLVIVDPHTGGLVLVGPTGLSNIGGLAFAPDGTLYGVTSGFNDGGNLVTLDPMTGAGSLIGWTGFNDVAALEFSPDGTTLYAGVGGNDPRAGSLIRIDPETGLGTLIGPTGFPAVSGLSFSPPEFVSVDATVGTVVPDSFFEIAVNFDARGLSGAVYTADIVIISNDPDEPEIVVPIHLHVTGAPDIAVADNRIDFGSLFVGKAESRTATVINTGTEVLTVSAITSSLEDFATDVSAFDLAPGKSRDVEVVFTPTAAGEISAILTIASNDPDEPVVELIVNGVALTPPEIVVDPEQMQEALFTGARPSRILTIANTGGSDLEFEIHVISTDFVPAHLALPVSLAVVYDDPANAVLGVPPVAGGTLYASTGNFEHLITVDSATGAGVLVGSTAGFGNITEIEFRNDGALFATTGGSSGNLLLIDAMTGRPALIGTHEAGRINALEFDDHGTLYGVQFPFSGEPSHLVTIDPATAEITVIGPTGFNNVGGLAFAADGTLYGVTSGSSGGSDLITIDLLTGSSEVVGATGFNDVAALEFSPDGNILYGGIGGNDFNSGSLIRIDPETGVGVVVARTEFPALSGLSFAPYIFLTIEPVTGVVAPDSTAEIAVTFDTAGLAAGDYFAEIVVLSNDPDEPKSTVPVHLQMIDAPDIELAQTHVDFGATFVGGAATSKLTLTNAGAELLTIADVVSDSLAFFADITELELNPGDSRNVGITFAPPAEGEFTAGLTIASNDPDEPEAVVSLAGRGLLPPAIMVDPAAFQDQLFTGQMSEHLLTIANTGFADLAFAIRVARDRSMAPFQFFFNVGQGINAAAPASGRDADSVRMPVLYAATEEFDNLITIDPATATGTLIGSTAGLGPVTEIEFRDDGRLFGATGGDTANLITIDVATGFATLVRAHLPYALNGLEFDENGILYGTHIPFPGGPSQLVIVDEHTGGLVLIGPTGFGAIGGLALAPDGTLYGVTADEGFLIILDMVSGAAEFVGATGFENVAALEFSPDGRTLYGGIGGVNFHSGSLVSIDPETGIGTLVGHTGFPFISGLSFAPPEFVLVDVDEGVVTPGTAVEIVVNLNAHGLDGGDYFADLVIISNDPLQPEVIVPVDLQVIGAPDIDVNPMELEFAEVLVGATGIRHLTLANIGTELLTVTDVAADHADFSANGTKFDIAPGAAREMEIIFAPSAEGPVTAILAIAGNDPDEPAVDVGLHGIGVLPPDIRVDPSALAARLAIGETSTQQLTIANDGNTNLEFEILIAAEINSEGETVRSLAANVIDEHGQAGEILGVFENFPVDNTGMVWVDEMLYVVDFSDSLLSIFDTANEAVVGSHKIHPFPYGIAWDGQTFWIGGGLDSLGRIVAYDLEGNAVGELNTPFSDYSGIAWDGQHFIVATTFVFNPTFYRIDPDGAVFREYQSSFNGSVFALEWVPEHADLGGGLWVNDSGNGRIVQLALEDGVASLIAEFPISDDAETYSLAHDGMDLWWSDSDGPLFRLDDGIRESRNWLMAEPLSGSVAAAASQVIDVRFSAGSLLPGAYEAGLVIVSNDPDEPEVFIPAQLDVVGVAAIRLSDSFLDFGPVFTEDSVSGILTIFNDGTDLLRVTDITATNAVFTPSALELEVNPGESLELEVLFSPQSAGPILATLTMSANDPNNPRVSIELKGTGVHPPEISVQPQSISAELFSGESSVQVLTIVNEGRTDLEFLISLIADGVSGQEVIKFSADFIGGLPASREICQDWTDFRADLIPQAYTKVVIRGTFDVDGVAVSDPDIVAQIAAALRTGTSGSWSSNGRQWGVGGCGSGQLGLPSIELSANSVCLCRDPGYTVRPCIVTPAWGGINTDTCSATDQTMTLEFTVEDTIPWLSLDQLAGTLGPEASVGLQVTIDAQELVPGDYRADIVITSNDPVNPEVIVPVSVDVAGAPNIEVSGEDIDFGAVFVSATEIRIFTIANAGAELLTISEIAADHADFAQDITTLALAPDESHELEVAFSPSAEGEINATLTINSDDPDEPVVLVKLQGVGVLPPDISVEPAELEERIQVGATSVQQLTIVNEGIADLEFDIHIASDMQIANTQFLATGMDQENKTAGEILGVFDDFPVFNTGMVWVGEMLYVVDNFDGLLRVYDPAREQVARSIPIHSEPYGIAWDGQHLWIGDSRGGAIVGYDLEGNIVGELSTPFFDFSAITWDGENFIVNPAFAPEPTFYKIDAGGRVVGEYRSSFNGVAFALAWVPEHVNHGGGLWVNNSENGGVAQLALENGIATIVTEIPIADDDISYSLAHDGADLWWSDFTGPLFRVDDGIRERREWLTAEPLNGVVKANSSATIDVRFDAGALPRGEFEAGIVIISNDPDEPEVVVPVHLDVIEAAAIELSAEMLEFGKVVIDDSRSRTLTIFNAGTVLLTVTNMTSTDPVFTTDVFEFEVNPGASRELEILFSPGTEGEIEAALKMTTNDPGNPLVTVSLKGAGVHPPAISVQPESIAAELFTGGRAVRILTIANTGRTDLDFGISLIAADGSEPQVIAFAADFIGGQPAPPEICDEWNDFRADLVPQAYTKVVIWGTFDADGVAVSDPDIVARIAAALHDGVSDSWVSNGRSWSVGECGFGQLGAPSLELSADDSVCLCRNPGYTVRPCITAPDWGGVNTVTCDATDQTMAVEFTLEGKNVSWLSIDNVGATVEADATMELQIFLDAQGLHGGDYAAEIIITSNDPVNPELNVPVNLEVTGAADIVVSKRVLDFGLVEVGKSDQRTLAVFNEGTDVLAITGVAVDRVAFTPEVTEFELNPGESREIAIVFTPVVGRTTTATLTLTSNDPDEASIAVSLTGTGVLPPRITVDPVELREVLFTGAISTRVLTISNSGGDHLQFDLSTAMSVAGPNPVLERVGGSNIAQVPGYPDHADSDENSVLEGDDTITPSASLIQKETTFGAITATTANRAGVTIEITQPPLPIVIEDPIGDGDPVDVTRLSAETTSAELLIEIQFSDSFNDQLLFSGILWLDTDQNHATGVPPDFAEHDIGAEFELRMSFFELLGEAALLDTTTGAIVGEYPVYFEGFRLVFSVPIADLNQNDGNIDISGVVFSDPVPDVFPDAGHGTIGETRATWLTVVPEQGTVPPGNSIDLEITFDAGELAGGDYATELFITSNDPQNPQILIPVQLVVNTIRLDREVYRCDDLAVIEVQDSKLAGLESLQITAAAASGDTESVPLGAVPGSHGDFTGEIRILPSDPGAAENGILEVEAADAVTVWYDRGETQQANHTVFEDTATIDCVSPAVLVVRVVNVTTTRAEVVVKTNESSLIEINYGLTCRDLAWNASAPDTTKAIILEDLIPSAAYYLEVLAVDQLGNTTVADNDGQCYSFTTAAARDYSTEIFEFGDDNDLEYGTLIFTPNDLSTFYDHCRETAAEFPTDPRDGTILDLADDDVVEITLTGDRQVSFFGNMYSSIFVGSNGYVTFGVADVDGFESAAAHFLLPRISALFDDLDPSAGGAVSWQQLDNRVVFTYVNIAEYLVQNTNDFQIEVFFDGRVTITHLGLDARDGLVGISAGLGVPPNFVESDFTARGCAAPGLAIGITNLAVEGVGADTTVRVDFRLDGSQETIDITMQASNDGGIHYDRVPVVTVSGNQIPDTSATTGVTGTIVWAAGIDWPEQLSTEVVVRLIAGASASLVADHGPFALDTRKSIATNAGGVVWHDQNNDGIRNSGETGIARIRVSLFDADGNFLEQTTTSESGAFVFNDLDSEFYSIEFKKPVGFDYTLQDATQDEETDSDAQPASGRTPIFTLRAGAPNHINAGLTIPVTNLVLDIDKNNILASSVDGAIVLRYLFGFEGHALHPKAMVSGCGHCTPDEIEIYLDALKRLGFLDADNDGTADALSDGLIIVRFLLGFENESLVSGLVSPNCGRCTPEAIRAFLTFQ